MKSKLMQSPSGRARERSRVRIVATLRVLLRADGDGARAHMVDLEAWVDEWMQLPLPELNGKSPAQALRRSGGWTLTRQVLERMAGGVCA